MTIAADEKIAACSGGLPIGWSLGLWFSQEALSQCCRRALGRGGMVAALLADRIPPPALGTGRGCCAPYVDNGKVIGGTKSDAGRLLEALKSELRQVGFSYHEEIEPTAKIDLFGWTLDLENRRLMLGRRRLWRLWFALDELLARPWLSGQQMRVVVGHLVDAFCLRRELLSTLCQVYVFAGHATAEVRRLPQAVVDELLVARDLLMLCVEDLGREPLRRMYCYDASGLGYEVHSSGCACRGVLHLRPLLRAVAFQAAAAHGRRGHTLHPHVDRGRRLCAMVEVEAAAVKEQLPGRFLAGGVSIPHVGRRLPREEEEGADSVMGHGRWTLVCARRWRSKVRIHHGAGFAALVGLRREAAGTTAHNPLLACRMAEVLVMEKGSARKRAGP